MHTAQTARQDYHNSLNLIFIFFIRGRGNIKIDGLQYEITAGDVILLNPSEYFLFHIDNDSFHERIVLFTNMKMIKSFPCDCSAIFSLFYKRKKGVGNILPSEAVKEYAVDQLFYQIPDIMRDECQTREPLAICKIVEILCVLNKALKNVPTANAVQSVGNTLIDTALHYINDNLTKKDITVQEIAAFCHVHRSYLSHTFKAQIGLSLWNYVVLRRIYKFNSLINDYKSVEEIAFAVGFSNYSNFFRLYKKYMGMTPLEFKQQAIIYNKSIPASS